MLGFNLGVLSSIKTLNNRTIFAILMKRLKMETVVYYMEDLT